MSSTSSEVSSSKETKEEVTKKSWIHDFWEEEGEEAKEAKRVRVLCKEEEHLISLFAAPQQLAASFICIFASLGGWVPHWRPRASCEKDV